MLELQNVNSYYRNSRALQDVSMSVGSGEFLSVLGRNGVGKTTLLKAILGLMDRTTGSIKLDGDELIHKGAHVRARAGIGYVPQGRGIFPSFTVRENLRMGTFAAHGNNPKTYEWIFELFPILKDFLNRQGGNLSGGQQQQLAIGRALLTEPKIILLDEPTEGIQPNIVEQIEEVLVDLNTKHGMTVVLVEQNVQFARRASQRFLILERGSPAVQGTATELTDELVHKHMAV